MTWFHRDRSCDGDGQKFLGNEIGTPGMQERRKNARKMSYFFTFFEYLCSTDNAAEFLSGLLLIGPGLE